MTSRLHDTYLDADGFDVEQAASYGEHLAVQQRGVNWWIGDIARHARDRLKLGDNLAQVFPEWMSPGLVSRCEAVARAYPREADRNPLASWTIHMTHANKPDRLSLVAAAVDAGRTSDEERRAAKPEAGDKQRWLLAVDVSYFLHRFWFSGAGVEAAVSVATWLQRTVERMKEKGLTDVACCFDSKVNHRKEFTKEWEDKYKERPPKDPELGQQLNLVYDLLKGKGFACVGVEGMEGDDVMASFAKQFPGRVTLMSQDKDLRQALSEKCNMLLDVEWRTDDTTGESLPEYKWLSAASHTEKTGIPPGQWVEFQMLMGDATDGIKGAPGVGEKGAADIIKLFGTVEAAIAGAKVDDERLKPRQRASLIAFEPKAEVTRKLVTLRTDLPVPTTTKI